MSWIAYVGPFQFPWGQAASRRVYGNARSLAAAGYQVVVASGSSEPLSVGPVEDYGGNGQLRHIGLDLCPRPADSEFKKAYRTLVDACPRLIRWLDEQPTRPSHVILYGGYAAYLLHLLPWCRRNSVALVCDVVEWYEESHLKGGALGLSNANSGVALRYMFARSDGIIAISTYLSAYFREKGCPVALVPPTLDVTSVVPRREPKQAESVLELTYAGEAGKKDLLRNIVQGVLLADAGEGRVRLQLVGSTDSELCSLLQIGALPPNIRAVGRVPQQEVSPLIRSSDFTVLLREDKRYARAGFSTKFVESVAHGTPMIGNITGDLSLYLHDGVEGLVCQDFSAEALADTIRRATQLTQAERLRLRCAARSRAEESFDYRLYSGVLCELLDRVRVRKSSSP